jgi:hypothetical protein
MPIAYETIVSLPFTIALRFIGWAKPLPALVVFMIHAAGKKGAEGIPHGWSPGAVSGGHERLAP